MTQSWTLSECGMQGGGGRTSREEAPGGPSASIWESPSRPNGKAEQPFASLPAFIGQVEQTNGCPGSGAVRRGCIHSSPLLDCPRKKAIRSSGMLLLQIPCQSPPLSRVFPAKTVKVSRYPLCRKGLRRVRDFHNSCGVTSGVAPGFPRSVENSTLSPNPR